MQNRVLHRSVSLGQRSWLAQFPKYLDGFDAAESNGAGYAALIDGKPGAFGAVVPDLPGCTSAGQNFDEAVTHAVEAVRLWIEDALADGEAIPSARAMEILRTGPDIADALAQGAAFARVPVLVDSGRPAKANLSLDSGLLAAIDAAAAARGVTRSAFLASAARNKIALEG